jgi:hypothetical protein
MSTGRVPVDDTRTSSSPLSDQKAYPSTVVGDIKERQKLYDQRRQVRERVMRGHQTSAQEGSWTSKSFPFESDFTQTRKVMPERDRLAENLFKEGSLQVGMMIMDDLVRPLQTKKSKTYCLQGALKADFLHHRINGRTC